MRAEIIAIGDELSSGQRLDTNSQWIASQLANLGIRTAFHSCVGDNQDEHVDALKSAAARSELVISTGGLGPTADDLTREAIAVAFSLELKFEQSAMDHIEALFAHRNREMPQRNRIQAMFPQGSRQIANRFGTAPGIDVVVNEGRCRIFALPGVPAEMHEMFTEVVRVRLVEEMGVGKQQWFYQNLRLFGIGESDVETRIPDLIARQRQPIVGITVSKATINLRIATLAENQRQADALIAPTVAEIQQHLGEFVYGQNEQELWDVVVQRLSARKETLQLIEFGSVSVLAEKFSTAASQHSANNATIAATVWRPGASTDWIETAIEPACDWTLCIGPYPRVIATKKPTGQFTVTIYHLGEQVEQLESNIGGHPEIVLLRMAKFACQKLLHKLD